MKKKVALFIVVGALAIGGTVFGFNYKKDCPLADTKDCPEYQNCPKKGQPDCPLVQNSPKKGTADCPYENGTASCCDKETPECCKKK